MSLARFVLAMAWRESRAGRRRLALLVSGVTLGVAALVAIHSFGDSLRDSVSREARALLGADLALSSGFPLPPLAQDVLGQIGSIAGDGGERPAVARVTSFGAMAWAPGRQGTRLVQVAAVEPGYPFYGRIVSDPAREWEALGEQGGVLVDPSLLESLGLRTGDTLALGEARFPIRGTIVSVPGDVGLRSAFGSRVFIPANRLAATRLLVFGSRARYEAYVRLPAGVDAQPLADRHRKALAAARVNIRSVSEDQSRLNETLSRLRSYFGLVALVALLLGGLGVASAVHVFVKRKLETVAVLRCLGASARTVLCVYLVQAVAVGLLGALAGAVLGLFVQLALPRVLADLIPVDVELTLSWPAVAAGVGVGLWVAVVFALLPLLAVRRVSPLAVLRRPFEQSARVPRDRALALAVMGLVASVLALALIEAGELATGLGFAGGIGTALGVLALVAAALMRAVRRFFPGRLPYVYRQGLANLYRPANQTLSVVLSLGFGTFLLSTLLLVQTNLLRDLRVDSNPERPNLVFFDVQTDQRAGVEGALRAAGAPFATVPIVPMRIQAVKGREVREILGEIDDWERSRERWAFRREYRSSYRDQLADSERLLRGAWWRPGEWRERSGVPVPISLEEGVARELEVDVGDAIVWDIQGLALPSYVASLREVNWARFEPNFFVVFPEGPLDPAPQMFAALTRVGEAGRRAELQRRVVESNPNVSTLDLSQLQQTLETLVDRVALAIRFMALFSLAAGAVVLGGAVAASRQQRVREGALLRTLGATRRQLFRILFAEYACLGVLSAATAVLLAWAASWALIHFVFESGFVLPLASLLALAGGVVALTVALGLAGSAEVFRRSPLEVLRAE